MPDPVLVLGAAGFIGRHVCLALARAGHTVHGIGHGALTAAQWARWGMARWTQADLTLAGLDDAVGTAVPTGIVHCAGSGSVAHSYAMPLDDHERSVATTAAALEFARLRCNPGTRVVLTSSAAVYGDQGDVDLGETSVRSPISPYGFHKVGAENLCDSYARFFGVHVSIVRLFSVYGEGLRKQLLWDALNKLSRPDATFFGTGNELRDWIHVSDAATLLCAALTAPQQAHFEIYNGGHVKASTRTVLSTLARAQGVEGPVLFTGQTHSGNPRRLTADCGHAHRQLAWQGRVGLDEGLARYATWFRRQACDPSAAA